MRWYHRFHGTGGCSSGPGARREPVRPHGGDRAGRGAAGARPPVVGDQPSHPTVADGCGGDALVALATWPVRLLAVLNTHHGDCGAEAADWRNSYKGESSVSTPYD